MTQVRTAIQDFSTSNEIYANAEVYFYTVDDDGEKTNDLATLYSALTGGSEIANPQTLDSYGKFRQPVYIDEGVIGTVTGLGNTPDHDTGVIRAFTGRREADYFDDDTAITIDPSIYFNLIDTTAGNVTVTMPDPSAAGSIGQTVIVKRNTGGANTLTVLDVEGGNNVSLTTQNYYIELYSNGSDWFIVSERR